jgi:hypothetical protein
MSDGKSEMARSDLESSNALFQILSNWNDILRSTSLNENAPAAPKRKAGQKG